MKCVSDIQTTPKSTEEVREIINRYTSVDKLVRIRATRRGSHTPSEMACAGRRDSTKLEFDSNTNLETTDDGELGGVTSITLLLHLMNRIVSVDTDQKKITVEAGMTLHNLANAAEANNMSVLAGALSIYGNLTLGGVISSSAHGSGLGSTCSLGDLVTKAKWVNGRGEVIVSDAQTKKGAKELKALIGGLGLLGIITEFTLQLEPYSWTIVETRNDLHDANIVAELKNMLQNETPHVISFWRPDFSTYRAILFTPVKSEDALTATAPAFDPNARAAYMAGVDSGVASKISEVMAAWGDEDTSDSADLLNEGQRITSFSNLSLFLSSRSCFS